VVTLPTPPTRSGYACSGWNTVANGSGSPFGASTTVSADIEVYAQWTANSYTVTFNKNGGDTEASPSTKTVTTPATTIDSLPTEPTWSGYTFTSWNTADNGLGSPFSASTIVNADIEVYAQWTAASANPVTITIDAGDAGDAAFSEGSFTIIKGGTPNSQVITLSGSGFTNPRWFVDAELKGTGNTITLDAADYSTGGHFLTLKVYKDGATWSKELAFTVN
jgi:uncharacterized repeat protein (TIGR02543 family)